MYKHPKDISEDIKDVDKIKRANLKIDKEFLSQEKISQNKINNNNQ